MKYFVISDIHSYYDAMIAALESNDFKEDDQHHHLLVLGDLFDRGDQAIEVLEYLYRLNKEKKATIIVGNHDLFLLDFLEGDYGSAYFNIAHNGFGRTIETLSGLSLEKTELRKVSEVIIAKYPYLKSWIKSWPYYLEIGKYVFVHGGIDGDNQDWKTTQSKSDLVWSHENNQPELPGKIVVAGHTRIPTVRYKTRDYYDLFKNHPETFDILYLENKILIDCFVEVSNKINVLILEIE
jgi:serine/threonine protein phosphatase 1